jgi:hypothetical protein
MKTRFVVAALVLFFLALLMFAKTYKYTYPIACSDLRPAVKDTLSKPHNYTVKKNDDAKMTAYDVKHTIHIILTETVLQRTNKVPKGTGCEMQVVSNYSGVEHNDREDFEKRVDGALWSSRKTSPTEPATPVTK